MSEFFFLGIDAGGSRTQAALVDAQGTILARAEMGAGSLRLGAQHAHARVIEITARLICNFFDENNAKKCLFCAAGFAGFSLDEERERLRALPFPFRSFDITSDADIACIGAHAGEDGAIVIAGTGSIGYARVGGEIIRVGGYGFPHSDEGSGAWIGLQAMKSFRAATSENSFHQILAPSISYHSEAWWRERAKARDFATLAPLVFTAALQGDAAAREILQRAGSEISAIALALIAKGAPAWSLMGGLAAPLQPFLTPEAQAKQCAARGDAVDGALRLARRAASRSI